MEMEAQLQNSCPTHGHGLTLTIWCCEDNVLVCYKCLLFGHHKGHQYLDEEETRYRVQRPETFDIILF